MIILMYIVGLICGKQYNKYPIPKNLLNLPNMES